MSKSKGWGVTFAVFFWQCVIVVIIMMIGYVIAARDYRQNYSKCQEQLSICNEILNDPHHCVSVVVETLKGDK